MDEQRPHRRAKEILADALQRPAEERAAYVAQACDSDAALLAEVQSLLKFAGDDSTLIDPAQRRGRLEALLAPQTVTTDAFRQGSGSAAQYSVEMPVRVGHYQINRLVGEGGMGRVFEALQENPRRPVALKVIRAAECGPALLRRFEYEAQTLGRLEHPGIARIYEAGAAEVILSETPRVVAGSPQPFIAMEFIEGEPLDAYARRMALSIPDRLRLFMRVCQAVNYAHTKGVIHRDLKPSNIFVATDGTPKVLDFGIARAAEDADALQARTQEGQPVGTPAYMSPEQAAGSSDIDTRTDVYALGVLLYELLTGAKPFDPRSLKTGSFAELQRLIREVEPPKPSTLISADSAREIQADKSGTDWRRLRSMVEGELDWIVLKCLEKDRTRRYESASALADDIGRYLDGEAVVAAPPSRAYLLRKFLRRHKGSVMAALATGAALLLGAVGFAWQAQAARNERDRAVKAEAQTRERADELQKLSDFQSQMLAQVDATAAGLRLGADVRARLEAALRKAGVPEEERAARLASFSEAWARVNATDTALELIKTTILQPALAAIDRQFADQPQLNAALRSAISSRYVDLGLLDDARAITEEVLRIRRGTLGEDHPDTIGTLLSRCKDLCLMGRPAEAEAILRPLIERAGPRLGLDEPLVLMAHHCLGEALLAQNKLSEAETLLRTVLAVRRRVLGDDHRDTLATIGNLAMVLRGQARFAAAETFAREVLERRQRMYSDDHPETLTAYNNLATIQLDAGRLAEAVEGFRKAAEGWRRVQGEAHRNTLLASNNLAAALGRLEKHAEAEAIQRDLLERTRRILGPDHPDTLMVLSNLANTLISLAKFDEAEPLCFESVERRVRMFGENSAEAITAYNTAGFLRSRQRRYAEVEPFLRKAIEASQTVWGEDHPERLVLLLNLGILLRDLGRPAESEACLRDVLARSKRVLGPAHPRVRIAVGSLGVTLFVEKKFAEIAQLLDEAEPDFRAAAAQADTGELRGLLLLLGKARTAIGAFAAAETALQEAHAQYFAVQGPAGGKTRECMRDLVALYNAWHAAEPDKGHDAKAAEWRAKLEASQASTRPASQPAAP